MFLSPTRWFLIYRDNRKSHSTLSRAINVKVELNSQGLGFIFSFENVFHPRDGWHKTNMCIRFLSRKLCACLSSDTPIRPLCREWKLTICLARTKRKLLISLPPRIHLTCKQIRCHTHTYAYKGAHTHTAAHKNHTSNTYIQTELVSKLCIRCTFAIYVFDFLNVSSALQSPLYIHFETHFLFTRYFLYKHSTFHLAHFSTFLFNCWKRSHQIINWFLNVLLNAEN